MKPTAAIWHARREELLLESPSPSHSGLFGARFARGGRTIVYGALDSRQIYEFDTLNTSRRKLELDPQNPKIIKTVYGAGYVFSAAVTWS